MQRRVLNANLHRSVQANRGARESLLNRVQKLAKIHPSARKASIDQAVREMTGIVHVGVDVVVGAVARAAATAIAWCAPTNPNRPFLTTILRNALTSIVKAQANLGLLTPSSLTKNRPFLWMHSPIAHSQTTNLRVNRVAKARRMRPVVRADDDDVVGEDGAIAKRLEVPAHPHHVKVDRKCRPVLTCRTRITITHTTLII
jgi:hypothetical protein